jgi:hypothetical protein
MYSDCRYKACGTFLNITMELPDWYKIKGYYHISPPSAIQWKDALKTVSKITNTTFVSRYGFFPLLHTNINERKYKKHPTKPNKRCHSYYDNEEKKHLKTVKVRPLHYANHLDALIFGYYAYQLQQKYDDRLNSISDFADCITAYRKIPIPDSDKNKGTIHFAHEAFSEIKRRARKDGEIGVLTFDIKSFFPSLDHPYLQQKWKEIMGFDEMPPDHLAVLKAATQFSFIYKDDLRKFKKTNGRRTNFDEKNLAAIGNQKGYSAFFSSPRDFRDNVKDGKIRIYPNSFRNKEKEVIGIPQGLPISAILANLYLLDFDTAVFQQLVTSNNCYYRRYSDDIVLICGVELMEKVKTIVDNEMNKCHVKLNKTKTEKFIFKNLDTGKVQAQKITPSGIRENLPFTYLGFEFYGDKTLIKSANLAKFYRRMIYAVKSKAHIAKKLGEQNHTAPIIYKKQLFKIYRNIDLDKICATRRFKLYVKIETGEYRMITKEYEKSSRGNYFSYAKRAAEIMDEPAILKQIQGEKRVFNQAIQKHFMSHQK